MVDVVVDGVFCLPELIRLYIFMVAECHFYLTTVTTLALDGAVLTLCGCGLLSRVTEEVLSEICP